MVLLADDKYAHFPFNLTASRYTYVVLGVYWISHAWGMFRLFLTVSSEHITAEYQSTPDGSGRVIRWKFAFQWCDEQGAPWWMTPKDLEKESSVEADVSTASTEARSLIFTCEQCRQSTPVVYKQGWMCLNPGCSVFWILEGSQPQELDYSEDFLRLLPQKFEKLPCVAPRTAVQTPGRATSYNFNHGWHCNQCGRLSSRSGF